MLKTVLKIFIFLLHFDVFFTKMIRQPVLDELLEMDDFGKAILQAKEFIGKYGDSDKNLRKILNTVGKLYLHGLGEDQNIDV